MRGKRRGQGVRRWSKYSTVDKRRGGGKVQSEGRSPVRRLIFFLRKTQTPGASRVNHSLTGPARTLGGGGKSENASVGGVMLYVEIGQGKKGSSSLRSV